MASGVFGHADHHRISGCDLSAHRPRALVLGTDYRQIQERVCPATMTTKIKRRCENGPVLILMRVMLLALVGFALFYLATRTGAHGILVHWRFRKPHVGRFYVRELTFDSNGN